MPGVRPVTAIGDELPGALMPPQVAVYPVMALPPLDPGAVKATLMSELPAVAVPMVGAPGTVNGVALLEALDAVPGPAVFMALTVQV